MSCRRNKDKQPKNPPPYVLALYDFDPQTSQGVYEDEPKFAAPSVDSQLAFKRGDKLLVLSEQIDWWISCQNISSQDQGYVPTAFFAPLCIVIGDERYSLRANIADLDYYSEESRLVPCLEEQYVDLKYFPNAVDTANIQKPFPKESANIFSKLVFWWMTGLIVKGFKRPLQFSDLWILSKDNQANTLTERFQKQWNKQMSKYTRPAIVDDISESTDSGIENQISEHPNKDISESHQDSIGRTKDNGAASGDVEIELKHDNNTTDEQPHVEIKDKERKPKKEKIEKQKSPSLWYTMFRCFGLLFGFGSLLKLGYDALLFVNPYILKLIIQYIEGKGPQEKWRGYVYAVALFAVGTLQSLFLQQYFDKAVLTGMRARSAIMGIVYRKMLVLSNKGKKDFSQGDMVNLMSVDATKFQDITTYLNMVWSAPLQIIVTMVFLYSLLGWSMFAGVAILSLLLPFNFFVSRRIKNAQSKMMKQKDQRSKGMNDIFSGIKVLKLYAWEESFLKKIFGLRNKELKQLRSFMLWKALTIFAFGCTPFLVSLATFAVYVLAGNELNAEKAFVGISLFGIIRFPMSILPDIITKIIQCHVSVRRLTKFLQADELDKDSVLFITDTENPVVVSVEHGNFTWDDEHNFKLRNLNLEVEKGSLIAIVGQVGCGKSSLLSALLGEMHKLNGTVKINGSVAYVPQQAWIQNATLESNVLFGRSYNCEKYNRIIDACALRSDLEVLPGGDLTEIGEKGINLSGGQKQRVSIARSIYCGADIYLFDDPLSAVDAHVSKHIFDSVIGPDGLLKKKVRILVTHNVNFLPQVDKIIVMKNGCISEVGTYDELISSTGAYAEFLRSYANENDDGSDNDDEDEATIEKGLRKRNTSFTSITSEHYSQLEKLLNTKAQHEKRISRNEKGATIITEESSETGRVKISVFLAYLKSVGLLISIFVIIFGLGTKFFVVGARIWLADWSTHTSISASQRDRYLLVYGLLGLGHCLCAYLGSLMMIIGSCIAAKELHNKLLVNVLHCPMNFFERTPIGRLTNRFSKDINVVDDDIPATLDSFYGCLFGILGVIFTISYSTPLFLVALIPVGLIYVLTQRFYVASSRQLKRIESVRRSPIYNHYFESINGVAVIRAHKKQQNFIEENEHRIDCNQAAFAPSMYSNRWLAIRLEFVGNLIIFFAALFAVVSKDSITSGLAGLSISYAMQVTQTLNWMIRMTSKLETDVIAVERIKEYTEVPTEAAWVKPDNRPPESWPENGVVKINDLCVRYRSDLDYALRNISLDVNPAEKVGVVGRTGAGKSTIALALFRMIEASEGQIEIDNVNIADIGLQDLRSRLTIIPQDPVLFSGTIRFNLDPFDQFSDEAVWNALEISHLKDYVSGLPLKLNELVAEGGENFSVGQRQLICLARALLRKTKVLVLDEATAAVDMETDELIQRTIRNEFNHCTILTIAHRLNTVMDYDRILVLDRGQIIEFDSPQKLLQNKGPFYDMAKDANVI